MYQSNLLPMLSRLKNSLSRLPDRWIDFVLRRSATVAAAVLLISAAVLFYTLDHFKINTDLSDMISDKLVFRKAEKDFTNAFPQLTDNIVIVIDADIPELALESRSRLAAGLAEKKEVFETVFVPGGGRFFEQNGLLYLSVEDLAELSDSLVEVQPFLAQLSRNPTFSGLFSVLGKAVLDSEEHIKDSGRIALMFERLGSSIESASADRPCRLSWQELITNRKPEKDDCRKFIIVRPYMDYSAFYPAREAIRCIRSTADGLGLNAGSGVSVRITGGAALSQSDLESVESGIGLAGLASLALVGIVLYIGLRSMRLVFASLAALVTGLVWTLGFAICFIGSLNLISIAFAVLFIGLGIDYSIQICLRFQEVARSGLDRQMAIKTAAGDVSHALLLCTCTTAIGFYAFVPTAYAGASELGIISGTGMFINFFINLTLLPSLLNLLPEKQIPGFPAPGTLLTSLPTRYPRTVIALAAVAGLAGVRLLPKVIFDYNPLTLSNPAAESVTTAKELMSSETAAPWTISVVSENLEKASDTAARLEKLEEVEKAVTIAGFVPERQAEKLDIIGDIAFFMPPLPLPGAFKLQDPKSKIDALQRFERTLRQHLESAPDDGGRKSREVRNLYAAVRKLNDALKAGHEEAHQMLSRLEEGLLSSLAVVLKNIDALTRARPFSVSDLPEQLRQRYIAQDGRCRVEVFASENIADRGALERFVSAVRAVAPDATDAPVTILESGRAIVSAFRKATLVALLLISAFLLVALRSWVETAFVMVPLLVAVLLTAAVSVLLALPFNFANIIVLPLLLGIGVDYGIHIICRFRSNRMTAGGVLQTSTARAVFFSALTTIVSFGSLCFLKHRGTAGMGKMLVLCIGLMLLSTLVILPALLTLFQKD